MSRKDIQKLAQREGIKANLKSEVIIRDLLKKHPKGVPRLLSPVPKRARNAIVRDEIASRANIQRGAEVRATNSSRRTRAQTSGHAINVSANGDGTIPAPKVGIVATGTANAAPQAAATIESRLVPVRVEDDLVASRKSPNQTVNGSIRRESGAHTAAGLATPPESHTSVSPRVTSPPVNTQSRVGSPATRSIERAQIPSPTPATARPTEARVIQILRHLRVLVDERVSLRHQLTEAQELLIVTEKIRKENVEQLARMRRERKILEQFFMTRLQRDERLHSGDHSWKPDVPGEEEVDYAYVGEVSDGLSSDEYVESDDEVIISGASNAMASDENKSANEDEDEEQMIVSAQHLSIGIPVLSQ
ncbi:hypothetical protein BDW22DRAFT_1358966 [Trametopsis cervina]|nr:hypothetical protein BDW22DRAFT_1358966 [Trametopsis cervina]